MNKMKTLVFLMIGLMSGISWVHAGSNDAVQQLNAFIHNTQTLKANFSQILLTKTMASDSKPKSGLFYLSRPGLFRWSYLKPYQQEIVSNGKKVWFYDVDLEQVTVKTVTNALSMGPALLLSGKSEITDRFTLEQQPVVNGVAWLKLVPKEKIAGFQSIRVGLKNNVMTDMLMEDDFDQVTRISFSEIVTNPQLKPELFELQIPDGVDVIED
ncbi:MAG TPA: outer membrane lipoprotein chaperone LolA [Crenotrichaceae bacterium]|nr:outer membrane lipoprotein chaperone LolA [Crenotrichaceae bacterium]